MTTNNSNKPDKCGYIQDLLYYVTQIAFIVWITVLTGFTEYYKKKYNMSFIIVLTKYNMIYFGLINYLNKYLDLYNK